LPKAIAASSAGPGPRRPWAADADLRASLLSAITRGLITERRLLRIGHLSDSDAAEITDLLHPSFRALT
jgi:hypothetical protein